VMPSVNTQRIMYRVYQLATRGFTYDHLVRAGYPRIMSELMWKYELAYPNHLKSASSHALAPHKFRPNPHSSESPHVVCPTCKGSFALRTNNTLRKHACYLKISRDFGLPRCIVRAELVKPANNTVIAVPTSHRI
jgi:hypothetical protein